MRLLSAVLRVKFRILGEDLFRLIDKLDLLLFAITSKLDSGPSNRRVSLNLHTSIQRLLHS
jgi:hypothetical protein